MLAQKEDKAIHPSRAEFITHAERIPKRSHSAETVQGTPDNGGKETDPNKERKGETVDRRKIPRMFRKEEEEAELTSGHSGEETPNPTLENIEITLKGGVETKLFLNKLHLRGKYRWQTGSFVDRVKASASGGNPKSRLCSPDGETPLAALRAWLTAYGHKLEEESRKHVAGRIWINGHPRRFLNRKKKSGAKRDGVTEEMETAGPYDEPETQRTAETDGANQDPRGSSDPPSGNKDRGTEEIPQRTPPQMERNAAPETHYIGEDGDMEEEGRKWGHPIILPKYEEDNPTGTHIPKDNSRDTPATQATGWLKGLELMDQLCPRAWAKRGIRAGRRIPADFRAPYCSILTNICQHHDEAVCRGWTVKQRRLEKLLLCIQGMLHKLEEKEGEETDSKKSSGGKGKTVAHKIQGLHNRGLRHHPGAG